MVKHVSIKKVKKATQQIRVFAPENKAGAIQIKLDGVRGQYIKAWSHNVQVFQCIRALCHVKVRFARSSSATSAKRAEFDQAASAWFTTFNINMAWCM